MIIKKNQYKWDEVVVNKSDDNNEWQFVWGVKSSSDQTDKETSLETMNLIDITYNKLNNKYYLSIDTDIVFVDAKKEIEYIRDLFNHLTGWMMANKYDNTYKPKMNEVFPIGDGIDRGFESVEELYGCFKCMVYGFCGCEAL